MRKPKTSSYIIIIIIIRPLPPWDNRDGMLSQCGPLVEYHRYHFRTLPFSGENAIGNRMIKDQQRELTNRLTHTRSSLAEIMKN